MSGWREWWHYQFLGNDLGSWLIALAIFLVTFTVLPLLRGLISAYRRRRRVQAPGQTYFAVDLALALVEHTKPLFLWGVAVWLASRDLTFPPVFERWETVVLVVLFWGQVAQWVMTGVRHAID